MIYEYFNMINEAIVDVKSEMRVLDEINEYKILNYIA